MPRLLIPAAAALLGLCSCQSLKKDQVVITVHAQGTDMDSKKTVFTRPIGGRTVIFKIIPEFSTQSMAAFHPFPADNGTQGVAMKLDFKGTNSLELVTRLRHGEMLMTMVNGQVVDHVIIDRPITDGIFTIWQGFSDEQIAALDEEYPRIKDLKSSSTFIEMTPSTATEKKQSKRRAEDEEKQRKADEKRRARGGSDPEAPDGELVPLSELLKTSR
ncbi:MAG TPA: hypothetical protein PK490_20655 [Prosthecobacter sp.]|nr:hypothetical protein [Prosthecobacter sp.]HRK16704.1 hypothetical protein [Prosthecobacter sp.]